MEKSLLRTSEHILSLDPSGNFNEGKGRTGWVLFSVPYDKVIKFGQIEAGTSVSMEDHWDRHISLINNMKKEFPDMIVIFEDYLLYSHQAKTQINSRMETPQLIGVIKYACYLKGIPYSMQTASAVKTRWSDDLLCEKDYLRWRKDVQGVKNYMLNGYVVSDHVRDALRHAVHYKTFMMKDKRKRAR